MGRVPCCEKDNVKKGQWTPEEDNKLSSYIAQHGTRNWRLIPKNAGLQRCGKSCRLRWTNYLRPDLKHGDFSKEEEQTIVKLHSVVGNRWSLIAAQLPGRTDNDVKNHWNTKLKKQLSGMGIDPVTHKPFSHLIAEIATTLAPPQVAHLAEAALGCFKDEMLHLLTKRRMDITGIAPRAMGDAYAPATSNDDDKEETIQKIKLGLSRAVMQETNADHMVMSSNKAWALEGSNGEISAGLMHDVYMTMSSDGFGYEGEGSTWSQSMCTQSPCTDGGVADQQIGGPAVKGEGDDDESDDAEDAKPARKGDAGMFGSDCVLWDLSDDLMNPLV